MMRGNPRRMLKAACVMAAAMGVILFFGVAPAMALRFSGAHEALAWLFWPKLIYTWIVAAPCFAAAYEAWKVCVEIGRDNSFSTVNAASLERLSRWMWLAAALMGIGAAAMRLIDTALATQAFLWVFGALVAILMAVFARALSCLVRDAATIKNENDLTV